MELDDLEAMVRLNFETEFFVNKSAHNIISDPENYGDQVGPQYYESLKINP